MQDIWTLTQNIIKIEKKTGVSVYNNKQFLEWILNHESNLWDCQFILADTDGERISVDDTLNETGTCWITTDPTTWNAVTADVYDLFIGNVPAEEEDDTAETEMMVLLRIGRTGKTWMPRKSRITTTWRRIWRRKRSTRTPNNLTRS